MEFLKCKRCQNVVAFVKNVGNKISCCGAEMEKMIANNSEFSHEKHMPSYRREGKYLYVSVGEGTHPQTEAHHIEWIALVSKKGNQRKLLDHTGKPEAYFLLEEDDEILELYSYCNLHGLWEIK